MSRGTDMPTVSGLTGAPEKLAPEPITSIPSESWDAAEKAKRKAAEKRRHDNRQRKHGTPTTRAVICRVCHRPGGTLLHSADGYIHRDCQRRLDAAARRGQ